MKKIILYAFSYVCLLLLVALVAPVTEARSPCEDKVTFQEDDNEMCDPAGNSCIVIWGCPAEK